MATREQNDGKLPPKVFKNSAAPQSSLPPNPGPKEDESDMTEYFILAVGYAAEAERIDWAFVARASEQGEFVMNALVDRDFVVDLIRTESATFRTAPVNRTTGRFTKGASVHVLADEFLSTDANDIKRDNLGELPRFDVPKFEIDLEALFPLALKK